MGEAYKIAKKSNIKSSETEILFYLGQCYEFADDLERAYKYYFKAHKILDKANDFMIHAKVLKGLGLVCLEIDLPTDANGYLQRCLPLLERLGDKMSQVIAFFLQGIAILIVSSAGSIKRAWVHHL